MTPDPSLNAFFKDRSILVTGGAGFIGSHLVDALVERGARMRVLDNLSNGKLENLRPLLDRIEFFEKDLRDFAACQEAVRGVSLIFHQAALGSVPRSMAQPELSLEVNIQGTANLFSAARSEGIRSIIYASSSSVYGDSQTLPKREGEEGTLLSPYAYSKKVNEDLARLFNNCFGMDFIGLRYFNVFGPRQDPEGPYAAVIPRFFKACLAGDSPVIFGNGEQTRDFTYVGDVVEANLLAASAGAGAWNRAYNIAGGERISVKDLANNILKSMGLDLAPSYAPPRVGDVLHSQADLSAAQQLLGYRPAIDLARGLDFSSPYYHRLFSA